MQSIGFADNLLPMATDTDIKPPRPLAGMSHYWHCGHLWAGMMEYFSVNVGCSQGDNKNFGPEIPQQEHLQQIKARGTIVIIGHPDKPPPDDIRSLRL